MSRIALSLLLALLSQIACAQVYKCVQPNGKTAYQSTECEGGPAATAGKLNQPASSAAAQNTCSNEKLSLNFNNIPLRSVLQVIADFSGHKLRDDPSLTNSAAFHYPSTPWCEVLQDIAARHNLNIRVENRNILVSKR